MSSRLCPYCRRWSTDGHAACAVCRTALRFIQLGESASCGPGDHQWLAKELAKLLGEACTRLLLSPSSDQEGRGRSPLARRSRVPPPESQEAPQGGDSPPSAKKPSSGHRGDTKRPRGDSPVQEGEWRPSLRLKTRRGDPVISAAKRGVEPDYLSQAREQRGRPEAKCETTALLVR